jgi:hypothetical protein
VRKLMLDREAWRRSSIKMVLLRRKKKEVDSIKREDSKIRRIVKSRSAMVDI